ncbi:SDR family oxidoreductase [uncultured Sphingomonas sp.]|uniref:SDR family oxidoreductase n=1 Tax=uncultured Sphingomonas sp. TaxID=158754 RepID=UPI00262AAC56|nr:SDR family oxidoreductase [uncultured Sphingomonas sp.]
MSEITPDHVDATFDVNVKGTIFTVQKGLKLMEAGGSVILTGSTTGVMGKPAFSVYSASKAAVRALARSWAQDLRGTGIRVNVLSPGPTLTELAAKVVGRDAMIEMGATTPSGHVGEPSEVAAAAAFLASSDSSFMTGSELFTDGGSARN